MCDIRSDCLTLSKRYSPNTGPAPVFLSGLFLPFTRWPCRTGNGPSYLVLHDSFKYSSHGLGAGAEIILAIAMTLAMGPAGLGMGTVSAAGAGSLATTAVNSGISNNGDLGKVLKDTVSASSLKSAGVAMLTAGVGEELQFDPEVLSTNTILKATETAVADAAITTAIEGGSFSKNLVGSLAGQAINVGGAYGANEIGSTAFANGSLTKIGMHALLGGVLSMAQGSDFATGALAAGADEASVQALAKLVMPSQDEATPLTVAQGDQKMIALSGFIGVLAAAVTGGDPSVGASVAQNVTQNNYLGNASKDKHKLGDVDQMVTDLVACRAKPDPASCRGTVQRKYQAISDQDTGVALQHCGDNCGAIAEDANTGTYALDRWVTSPALTPEEGAIVDHFQDQNEHDYNIVDYTWRQGVLAQIVPGVLIGGPIGFASAEAEADAGAATVAGAKATGDSLDNVASNIHAGQQGKHVLGHNNFIPGRSYFDEGVDLRNCWMVLIQESFLS